MFSLRNNFELKNNFFQIVREEITKKEEIAIGNETGDTDLEAENAENDLAHVPKSAGIEKEALHPKRIAVLGEENHPFIGMYHLQGLNISLLYR